MFSLSLTDIDRLTNREKLVEWVINVITPHLDDRLDFILEAVHGKFMYRTEVRGTFKELKIYRLDHKFVLKDSTVTGIFWLATLKLEKEVITSEVSDLEEYIQAYLALKERFA